MGSSDFLVVAGIMGAVSTILGWWLRSRLDNSIKHEYDRLLQAFKAEQKRTEVLHEERLKAFKALSKKLLALKHYCAARSAELRGRSEFEPRTDSLLPEENVSLLQHHELIQRTLQERALFISPWARECLDDLLSQIAIGFTLEMLLNTEAGNAELNAEELYDSISARINDGMGALYSDLGFPNGQSLNSNHG